MTIMNAMCVQQFGAEHPLVQKRLERPQAGAGQVLVRIRAVGINPVDTYIRAGTYAIKPALPYVPCMDAAGVVAEAGEGTPFRVGERVYVTRTLTGAVAEYALCDANRVHALPSEVSFEQGAALGIPAATAWRALFQRGQAKVGETLLIHGATGSVGLAALQLAKAAGLTVIATGGTDEGRALLKKLGADVVCDHHDTRQMTQIKAHHSVNLIIEMLANQNLMRDLDLLAQHGRLVIVGNKGEITINPRLIMQKEIDIKGVMLFAFTEAEYQDIHKGLYKALTERVLTPAIQNCFVLANATKAFEAVILPGRYGKTVIVVD